MRRDTTGAPRRQFFDPRPPQLAAAIGPTYRLAVETVCQAVTDMRSTLNAERYEVEDRIAATVWLGSKRCLPWFYAAGLDHIVRLEQCKWAMHAERLIRDPERRTIRRRPKKGRPEPRPIVRGLTRAEQRLLEQGIRALRHRAAA